MNHTSPKDITKAVETLRSTFRTGLTKDFAFRKSQLKKLSLFMEEQKQPLLDAVYKDIRKSECDATSFELSMVKGEIDYMLKNMKKLGKPVKIKAQYIANYLDKKTYKKEPKGVVLIFSPWNYPISLSLVPVVGAIAAGNCILLKPSEISSHTSKLYHEILTKYLDPGVFRVVVGDSEQCNYLLEEKFDHIFFTGSGKVGQSVMAAAAKHLTPVTLELGGKSPAIVADDVDISVSAHRILWGKMTNAGQTCIAPDYVILSRKKVNEFVDVCRKELLLRYGEAPQKSKDYGRIANENFFDRLSGSLNKLDKSKILVGGQRVKEDLFIAPTIVGPMTAHDPLFMQEEIFGPILPIVPVDNIEEAIEIVNEKEPPLVIYVFTEKKAIFQKICENTKSGAVMTNDTITYAMEPETPFGGVGTSGMGNYHGPSSFSTFSYERALVQKSLGMENLMRVRYPPINKDKERVCYGLTMGLTRPFPAKIKELGALVASICRILIGKDK